jgi:hypothetical protein
MTTTDERSVGQLVASATEDLSALIRSEVALAKAELKVSVGAAAKGAGLFAGAAFVAMLAIVLLSITLALGIAALGLPGWVAFLIVTVFYLLVAGVLALIGKKALSKVGPPKRTLASMSDAKEILSRSDRPGHASQAGTATAPALSSAGSSAPSPRH